MFGTPSVTEIQSPGLQRDPDVWLAADPRGAAGGRALDRRTLAALPAPDEWRQRNGRSFRGVNKGRQRLEPAGGGADGLEAGAGLGPTPSRRPLPRQRPRCPAHREAVLAEGGWAGASGEGAALTPCVSPPCMSVFFSLSSPPPRGRESG